MAARRAGGDGPEGIANYLQGVAISHPGVFVSALSRIIPIEIDTKSGHITIEVIQRFDDVKTIEHKANGHGNGHAITNGNGHAKAKDPPAE